VAVLRYTVGVLRYAITDCSRFPSAAERKTNLLADAARWAGQGIDFVQLREKTLAAGEMLDLAEALAAALEQSRSGTKLLLNGRADVALAAYADGVHLTSDLDELTAAEVRTLFEQLGRKPPLIAASCHSPAEVARARAEHIDLIVFGPVFEKRVKGTLLREGIGLTALRDAVQAAGATPVLALGGIDRSNASLCLEAGAAGIAGIRLFS
jgi:thiamine-phosphate pyrophosphorylase